MTDFLPPEKVTIETAGETLCGQLEVRERALRNAQRTFYDTFDGLLHAAGVSLIQADGHLALLANASGEERARLQWEEREGPVRALDLAPGRLREELLPIVEVRALLPLARVRARIRGMDLLDDERKTVVRMALEAPELVAESGSSVPLRPRLRLAPVRGYDAELDELSDKLRTLGFRPAEQTLFDEAVTASGGAPSGTSAKVDVSLRFRERADAGAVAVLARLLEVIETNLQGTIEDIDSEFLHDLRVAVRRSRSVQRELRGVFPPPELQRFRDEFRWLQQATGDARDLDVYLLEFDRYRELMPELMRADLEPLLDTLCDRRQLARREMVAALRSDRATRLRRDWAAFLEHLVGLPEGDRPDAARPIGELAGERIGKVYRRMVKMGTAIDASSPPEHYHELRKKGKELRYLLELFGLQLYTGDVVKPMIRALKSLQDVLGRHQDREVQVATLQSLRDAVAARPGGAAALMATGVLVQRLREDEQAARDSFSQRFAVFASKDQRTLVAETFA